MISGYEVFRITFDKREGRLIRTDFPKMYAVYYWDWNVDYGMLRNESQIFFPAGSDRDAIRTAGKILSAFDLLFELQQ